MNPDPADESTEELLSKPDDASKGRPVNSRSVHGRWSLLALAYGALIVYGSLYPFSGWTNSNRHWLAFLGVGGRGHFHAADALTNVLAYVPFGLLLGRALASRLSLASSIVVASLAGAMLSFTMEFVQQFLPSRVASTDDLLTNSLGTLAGAILAGFVRADAIPMMALVRWRDRRFRPGRLADLGLLALALWALSQLTPLVPSVDIGEIRHGLAPLWQTLRDPARFNVAQWAAYALDIAGLALLAKTVVGPGKPVSPLFILFVSGVLLYKIPVVTRQLSLEAATGALTGIIFALPFLALRGSGMAWTGASLILGGFAVDELRAEPGVLYSFTWIPFSAQLEHPLIGIASMLENIWPAAALAYLTRFASASRRRAPGAIVGALFIGMVAFAFEWYQQFVPGRIGDITTVMLMMATWALVWSVPLDVVPTRPIESAPPSARTSSKWRRWLLAGALGALAVVGASTAVVKRYAAEVRVDESTLPKLPTPAELPPVRIANFRFAHPRLPSPTPSEYATLLAKNPEFLRQLRSRANGGRGDFDEVILQALLEPGSVDLDLLFHRLSDLKPSWRGHEQGKPLALGYDWLYSQWTTAQRVELREKLYAACDYLVDVIRNDRMSPYNVILYNSPFQALMACSIALYGDDPRGAPIMNFTYDLWKNRVLPVWRQVMGKNGGWHEGGEYVGVGIGQAIYELPAMWRSATGEDLFAAESGIRGFLDFLVYRTRPDGTHFRWGDGAFFDKIVPDEAPLALELRNAAAYSLHPRSREIGPTGWPWGPLSDPSLDDPASIARLPLSRVFDGIGMIVARSDWSPDATYVTFKAGDNYWSHVHLDQGAFTIYKGGALAIDSGLYGPTYGSDHHMNYSYQTIAHNAITVTDPEDTVPAPGKKQSRPIANDGGQRRIGSGWGVEAAPLDRAEWDAKRDIYHTGTLGKVLDEDGVIAAVSDVTPAYTNGLSGHGTFSHRTRRVERVWRTFGYDRVDDVVVVFDQVSASNASFRKRWLLHSIEAPQVTADGFTTRVPAQERPGHVGGKLKAKVLLPKRAVINTIGGRRLEFFVDDRNYDENGTMQAMIGKLGPNNGEPGAWRVEVSPPQDEIDDVFLVVLLPTLGDATPSHRVKLLESGGRVGCEIVGPHRTTRWWFQPGRDGAEIEIADGAEIRRHRVEGPASQPPPDRSWFQPVREWIAKWPH